MNLYFNSRQLSEKLDINLAKWKRWSREFLSPDPLGGLQSGVARQFSVKEAFKVYLGGFLVSELKLTIPEAQKALKGLTPWLKTNGFFTYDAVNGKNGTHPHQDIMHHLYALRRKNGAWGFVVQTFEPDERSQNLGKQTTLTFTRTLIGLDSDPLATGEAEGAQMIAISTFFKNFLNKIR